MELVEGREEEGARVKAEEAALPRNSLDEITDELICFISKWRRGEGGGGGERLIVCLTHYFLQPFS